MHNLDQRDIMLYAEIVQTYFKKRHDKYECGLSQIQIDKILELPTPCGDYQFKDIFVVDRIDIDGDKTTYTLLHRMKIPNDIHLIDVHINKHKEVKDADGR